MAEDFDPCHFLDVAAEAKFRFNIINRHATWFLAQGLDFENREGVAGLQYDFVELAMQPLERVDLKDAFDAHRVLIHKAVDKLLVTYYLAQREGQKKPDQANCSNYDLRK